MRDSGLCFQQGPGTVGQPSPQGKVSVPLRAAAEADAGRTARARYLALQQLRELTEMNTDASGGGIPSSQFECRGTHRLFQRKALRFRHEVEGHPRKADSSASSA
jgi:hypothetical protein